MMTCWYDAFVPAILFLVLWFSGSLVLDVILLDVRIRRFGSLAVNESQGPLQRVSLREQLTQRLEQMILSGDIPAGATLPSEREMVEQWSVSRSVVRDAIRTVESKGLIEVRHGVGAVVTHDVQDAFVNALGLLIERGEYRPTELLEFRVVLETEAAKLAAQNATEDDLRAMDRHLKEYWAAARAGDVALVAEADRAFHVCMIEATHNRPLIDLLAPLVQILLVKTVITFGSDISGNAHEDSSAKHRNAYECIKAGDADGAAHWIRVTFTDSLATLKLLETDAEESCIPAG